MVSVDTSILRDKYSKYAKKEPDWINEGPRDVFDNRKRVRRETYVGMSTMFHERIEDFLQRQVRAYTIPRIGTHLLLSILLTCHCK
jgi:hypothetical protein